MKLSLASEIFGCWLVLLSAWTFVLFGLDKWRAQQAGKERISESTLLVASALGGWPGGLAGMILFRHKSAKRSFRLRFFGALVVFILLIAGALRTLGLL